jgi:hypothetical protein
VKPGDPTGEHAVVGESTLSAVALAFSFPSSIIKKAANGIGILGHGLLRMISYMYRSILIDASIAVEPTIVLTLLLLLTLLVKVVAMKPGALKPAAVETASSWYVGRDWSVEILSFLMSLIRPVPFIRSPLASLHRSHLFLSPSARESCFRRGRRRHQGTAVAASAAN